MYTIKMRQFSIWRMAFSLTLLLAGLSALPAVATDPADPTPKASKLIREIRADLRPIEDQIRNHPYIRRSRTARFPSITCAPSPASSTTS